MKKIVLVGCGHLGQAMLRGWLADISIDAQFFAIDPKTDTLSRQFSGVQFATDLSILPNKIDAIIFALKPLKFKEILPLYQNHAGGGALVISVAAGITVDSIQKFLSAPGAAIVRAMPNLPSQIGQGIAGAFANAHVSSTQKQLAGAILSSLGHAVWVDDEKYMNVITATSGSGPAYIFRLCEAMAEAGVKSGLPADVALALATQTIIGSALYMQQSKKTPSELRQAITTPGGTTEAALNVLNQNNALQDLFDRAIAVATARGKILSGS